MPSKVNDTVAMAYYLTSAAVVGAMAFAYHAGNGSIVAHLPQQIIGQKLASLVKGAEGTRK